MTNPEILSALGRLHELQRGLLLSVPAADANRPFDARLGCLGWQLGKAVYRETYWLRERLSGDADLTARVRPLFEGEEPPPAERCASLPPPEHLVRWATEIQDEHLRRLATPGALPEHPLLADDRLSWYLIQENARGYERMLAILLLRSLAQDGHGYRAGVPLRPSAPSGAFTRVDQGHYRVGSRADPFAYDNELPPQAAELAGFRIGLLPVTNAEYLAFIDAGGYRDPGPWDDAGRQWLALTQPRPEAPLGWRRDALGAWYQMGLNGPCDLPAEGAASGLSRHEASAYAAWAARTSPRHAGAVLQHEYQWEVAARSGRLEAIGRAWEWCANPFHPYPEFEPFPDDRGSRPAFERGDGVLRGASMHTQPCLRRASYRFHCDPGTRDCFGGMRLVLPPD